MSKIVLEIGANAAAFLLAVWFAYVLAFRRHNVLQGVLVFVLYLGYQANPCTSAR